MSVTFRVGRHISPSGFALAMIDVPGLDPERNISLVDHSYEWEENVAQLDSSLVESYVDSGGHMPALTVIDFDVTNVTTPSTNDKDAAPLYFNHIGRFYHYTYGENPTKQVYITDQNENILKGINYIVRAERQMKNVYKIEVLTDFKNTEYVIYKVRYNRCNIDGSTIYPSWHESLNARQFFVLGNPLIATEQYSLLELGDGLWSCVVPPVPTLSELINSIGISFEAAPTTIKPDLAIVKEYALGVTVTYTLDATSTTTFSIKRDKTRDGAPANDYLTSSTADTWGSQTNFTIGTTITGIPGVSVDVNSDNYLKNGDRATFTAIRSYYYLKPRAYNSIYLKKPNNADIDDNWYLQVKNGRFRRRMLADGSAVPSGQGTMWEYAVPEYNTQLWSMTHGKPRKDVISERPDLLGQQEIQLYRTPVYIDPSDVLYNSDDPGFPPSSYMHIKVNDSSLSQNSILDWDVYNGTVKVAQILNHRDDIVVDYAYESDYYEYDGFVGSGYPFPTGESLPYLELDLNPTPGHSYGMYASGTVAHVFLRPYIDIDANEVVCSESLYHNFTGTPSGSYDFRLGSVSVGPHCKVADVEVTDVRTRGGGLSKSAIQDLANVEEIQPEAQFYWDVGYFDGKAFPSNGVLVINVPKVLLQSNGGSFEEDEIREKILKHMALGEYPIINYI